MLKYVLLTEKEPLIYQDTTKIQSVIPVPVAL